MWPFSKKRKVLHYEMDWFDRIVQAMEREGFVLKNRSMHVVGVVDLVTLNYERDGEKVTLLADNLNGIEVSGRAEILDTLQAALSALR